MRMITLVGYPNQESFHVTAAETVLPEGTRSVGLHHRWKPDHARAGKKAAFEQFHRLMADPGADKASVHTVYGLTQVYLDWGEVNCSAGTYDNHKRCLKSFIDSIGKTLKVAELRNHHVTKWVDAQEWNSTTKNDNMSTVFCVMNWAMEQGFAAGRGRDSRSPSLV